MSLTFRQYNYSKTISVKIPSLFVGLPSSLAWTRTTSLSLSFLQHNGRRSLPCASARARVALNMRRGVRSDLFFGNKENGISVGKAVPQPLFLLKCHFPGCQIRGLGAIRVTVSGAVFIRFLGICNPEFFAFATKTWVLGQQVLPYSTGSTSPVPPPPFWKTSPFTGPEIVG